MKLLLISVFFMVASCSDQDSATGQEKEKEAIDNLRQELVEMAEASICSEQYSCAAVGLGSKPCGGHWEYLVYSTSIDVEQFLEKTRELEALEKAYNEKHQVASDCMAVLPPTGFECEDGKCKAVYE